MDAEAILDRLLERQRAEPQYAERVARLRKSMRERHVSPEIIDRVVRLNPQLREGAQLRGIHYKAYQSNAFIYGSYTRGRAIRERGRAWLEALPDGSTYREGRRQFVTREAWVDFAPSAA